MAEDKTSFPIMPVRQWWALRDRFKKTVPTSIDAAYLSSALNMSETSARNNVMPGLRTTGIINGEGKPTDLAFKWRDDGQYAEVCGQIRKSVYPSSLLDLAPPESINNDEVRRWFQNTAKVGENAAQKMTAFYAMLCNATPQSSEQAPRKNAGKSRDSKNGDETKRRAAKAAEKRDGQERRRGTDGSASLHLNLQIHISPETTSQQIDDIFGSMARHLKEFL